MDNNDSPTDVPGTPQSSQSAFHIPLKPSDPSSVEQGHESGGYRSLLESSIDLVQSYRRSQSFIVENLPSSFSISSSRSSFHTTRQLNTEEGDLEDNQAEVRSLSTHTDPDILEEADDDLGDLRSSDGIISTTKAQINLSPCSTDHSRKNSTRSLTKRSQSSSECINHNSPSRSTLARSPALSASFVPSPMSRESLNNTRIAVSTPIRETTQLMTSVSPLKHYDSISSKHSTPLKPSRESESIQRSVALQRRSSVNTISNQVQLSFPPYGSSTFGQTLFNAFNILCGVGLLSEPLAFATTGWIGGTILFIFCGLATNYTAKLLASLMTEDRNLLTYNDICFKAFGRTMRYPIAFLFCLELFALSIALVVIFGDSFATVFPHMTSNFFKIIYFCIVLPTVFMPFQILSFASLIGLTSSLALVGVILIDGFSKQESPGSILHPAPTNLGPSAKWGLSAGLMMSGFAGHSIMPSLARDMKNPKDFNRMVDLAYLSAGSMYLIAGVAGYLMFGNKVSEEITKDMLSVQGYPVAINRLAIWMVGINPVAKFALCTRPLHITIEHFLSLNPQDDSSEEQNSHAHVTQEVPSTPQTFTPTVSKSSDQISISTGSTSIFPVDGNKRESLLVRVKQAVGKFTCRTFLTALVVLLAILIPQFERLMSFLGAFSAFVICIILPVSAELILKRDKTSKARKFLNISLLIVSVIMAGIGTTYTFM
ncbi:transmembrane amino acid transporter protein-domain-containing protein [Phakopsora pachyrhizi]|uniref:Transmembrane amino acid transporter protein-domain-containing protein n=1 Tax=Phakopsora pachyrhizi TaxID=170000 RepID=A0AAV0BWG6_PHAPC|nr:transmembrane amino acid transporter protein-domain-containing protein [Phakopsora pachyrhizi]